METENRKTDNQYMYQAVALGGFIAALTDTIPYLSFVNCLCCIGIAAGGAAALLNLKTVQPDRNFVLPELIQLGLLTGMAGAFIAFALHFIVFKMIGNWQIEWLTNMIAEMEELPPLWEDLYEEIQKPEMQGFAGIAILIRSLILFPVFTLGGVLLANKFFQNPVAGDDT